MPSGTTKRRIELRLRRPLVTWFARPTVVVDGVGQPAQWGTGTWAVPDQGGTEIGVYLYNRLWRRGTASITIGAAGTEQDVVEYRVGPLPLGPGRLTRAAP
jgi:hypothetical protein